MRKPDLHIYGMSETSKYDNPHWLLLRFKQLCCRQVRRRRCRPRAPVSKTNGGLELRAKVALGTFNGFVTSRLAQKLYLNTWDRHCEGGVCMSGFGERRERRFGEKTFGGCFSNRAVKRSDSFRFYFRFSVPEERDLAGETTVYIGLETAKILNQCR